MNVLSRIVKVRAHPSLRPSTQLYFSSLNIWGALHRHTLLSYTTWSYSWWMDSGLEFEWDPAKADANFRQHGITFDQAIGVFYDPMVVMIEDERFA